MPSIGQYVATFTASMDGFMAPIKQAQREATAFEKRLKPLTKLAADTGAAMTSIGKGLTAGVTLPLVAIGGVALKAASDFESSFAGVRKTVNATEAEFAKLSSGFREMSKEIPISVNELNRIGEAAGQLGIEKENIIGFSRVMADLGVATNLSSEQAATALARLANITQMPQTEFDRLGSTVVALGNSLATTESEIVEMGLRIAGAGKQVGLTEAEILGFAGALSSVGIEAQAGGSAISKLFIEIASQAETGGSKLQDFASVAGMSAKDYQRAFQENAAGATIAFVEGLGKMKDSGGSALGTLEALGITEVRMRDALLRASGAGDLFRQSIEKGSQAWVDNTALTNEAAQRYQTFESQFQLFKNSLNDAAISLGTALLPAMKSLLEASKPAIEFISLLAEKFAGLPQPVQAVVLGMAALAAAIGPVVAVGGLFLTGVSGWAPMFIKVVPVLNMGVIPAFTLLGSKLAALAVAGGPIFLVIAAMTALGAFIVKMTGDISSAHRQLTDDTAKWERQVLENVNTLRTKYDVALDTTGKSLEEISAETATATETAAWFARQTKDVADRQKTAATAAEQLTSATEDQEAATKKLTARQEDLREEMDLRVGVFERTHAKMTEETRLFGEMEAAMNIYTADIIENTSAHAGWALTMQNVTRVFDEAAAASAGYSVNIAGVRHEVEATQLPLSNINETLDFLRVPMPLIQIADVQEIKRQESSLKDAIASVKNSAGEVFDAMFLKGESVFASLGNALKGGVLSLGRSIFEDVTAALLGPIKKAFDDFFGGLLEGLGIRNFLAGLGNALGGLLGGLFGGGGGGASLVTGLGSMGISAAAPSIAPVVFGGAGAAGAGAGAGAGGGSAIAAFATNPATIAISAGIAAATMWIKSQAHHEANTFVQGFQKPFENQLFNVVGQFWSAMEKEALTGEAATAVVSDVEKLWDTFSQQAREFARGGSDEMEVVMNMFDHVGPIMQDVLGDMRSAVDALGGSGADSLNDHLFGLTTASQAAALSLGGLQSGLHMLISDMSAAATQVMALAEGERERLQTIANAAASGPALYGQTVNRDAQGNITGGENLFGLKAIDTPFGTKYVPRTGVNDGMPVASAKTLRFEQNSAEGESALVSELRQLVSLMRDREVKIVMDGKEVARIQARHLYDLTKNEGVQIIGSR